MTEELKSCPFCNGGTTGIHENRGTWRGTGGYGEPVSVEVHHWCEKVVGQPSPRLLAFVGRDKASAMAAWNRRTPDAHRAAQVEELLKALKGVTRIVEAFSYSNILYSTQKERYDEARALINKLDTP